MTHPFDRYAKKVIWKEEDCLAEAFPVTSSVLAARALLREVAADYALDEPFDCQLIRRGLNDSYLVKTATDDYVLRIYRPRWRSVAEILYELDLLCYLRQKNAPVSTPLERKDGAILRGLKAPEGMRYMALFTYAKGEAPTLTEEQSYQMGSATAAIHLASEGFTSPHARFSLDVEHLLHAPLQLAKPYLEHRSEDWAFLLRLADALSERIVSLSPRLDWGICHGDATERNAHITKEGSVTFFDFDCGGLGWRAYDWATFRMNARKRERGEMSWAAYLKGYTDTRPIHPIDMEAEPLLFVARILWSMGIFPATSTDDVAEPLDDGFVERQLRFLRPWAAKNLDLS
jgi:Ser/Thr protein kinase RdoA (MazF antagonist)